jgi:hypothetical protein
MTLKGMKMSEYEGLMPETLTVMAKLAVIVFGFASTAAAQATATVAGTVNDAQGAVIPGAIVTLTSEGRGTTFRGLTGATGDFVLTNVPGDTYTVSVMMTAFKKAERTGVLVVPGDRVAVPTIVLEVGALAETVEVSAQAPLLQAQTGERSATVTKEAVDNIPTFSSGTFFAQIVSLAPGVSATASNSPVSAPDDRRLGCRERSSGRSALLRIRPNVRRLALLRSPMPTT